MKPVLLVSNGHGEAAIADCIAAAVRALAPEMELDHLALVGEGACAYAREVGPRRAMPSGGLIAMLNVRNIVRDLRSGLLALTAAQLGFLRGRRERYGAVVAVGDVYALAMALCVRAPALYVGTAKSVSVAPYGPFERHVLRRAAVRFVRDEATAQRLREHGVSAEAANAIVDLFVGEADPQARAMLANFQPALALFPGSRESAYDDARFLLAIVHRLVRDLPQLGAVLSIAPGLDVERFVAAAQAPGFRVVRGDDELQPFDVTSDDRVVVRAWRGPLGALLGGTTLVLGQAGTANEAAAAAGIPVVAFERERTRKSRWYRKRQHGLLGEALALLPGQPRAAAAGVAALLADPERRARMGSVGRARMGPPGAARRIAERIVAFARAA